MTLYYIDTMASYCMASIPAPGSFGGLEFYTSLEFYATIDYGARASSSSKVVC